jgi:cell division protein FtsB
MSRNRPASQPTRRPGTKARSKRRKPFIPSLVFRGVFIGSALLFTSAMCWGFVKIIAHPYILGAQQAKILAQKRSELKQLEAQDEQLSQQSAYLQRPDGIEAAARTQGYLKPGEQSLVIEPVPAAGTSN